MKKYISFLLSVCLISEIIFPSVAFAAENQPIDATVKSGIVQEDDKKKSEIKEVAAYLLGVAGCATAIVAFAYSKLFGASAVKDIEPSSPLPEKGRPEVPKVQKGDNLSVKAPEEVASADVAIPEEVKSGENLKAIHWQDNLCWFNSTILMFYYHKDFYDCIVSFPSDEVAGMLHESIDAKIRSKLEAFTELTDTFRGIDRCNKIYRFPNRKLYDKLDAAIDFCAYEEGGDVRKKVKYGEYGIPFQTELYNVIADVLTSVYNILINNKEKFPKMNAWLSRVNADINPLRRQAKNWSLNEFFKNARIFQVYGPNHHYWINVVRGQAKYEIGKSIHDSNAVALIES